MWNRSTTEAKSHLSKISMSIAVSRRHREHRNTIAVTSWQNRRVIRLRCSYGSAMLCAVLLRSRYDLAMINSLLVRLCYWGMVNLGASATLPLRSWRTGQLQARFKCSPTVGVTLLDSWSFSVEDLVKHDLFHSHVIELEKWRAISSIKASCSNFLAVVPKL